jgi:hypothetical protein
MNETQIEARNDSLRGALNKMSTVRESRGEDKIITFEPYVRSLAEAERAPRRRRLFGFRERAQEAAGIENDPLFEALREDGVDIDAL